MRGEKKKKNRPICKVSIKKKKAQICKFSSKAQSSLMLGWRNAAGIKGKNGIFQASLNRNGFPGGSDGKESARNVGDPSSIPGVGRSPGEGSSNPLQYSCLENPIGRGTWQATVYKVTKSQTRLNEFTFTFQLLSYVWLFVAPWTVVHQAPPSMEFSRQENWNWLPFPSPGNLPNLGIEPVTLGSPAMAGGFFTANTIWEDILDYILHIKLNSKKINTFVLSPGLQPYSQMCMFLKIRVHLILLE